VQGTTGGCAIVRASMSVSDSKIENNGYSGIYLASNAYNYGAIYSQVGHGGGPSLYVSGSTISGNGYAGIAVVSGAYKYSAISQKIVIDSTTITHNGTDGTAFFAGPFGYTPQGGLIVTDYVLAGSYGVQDIYVQNGSAITDNKGVGIGAVTYGGLAYFLGQGLFVYDTKVTGNYTGVVLGTNAGPTTFGAVQQFYSYHSTFSNNVGGGPAFPKYGSGVAISMRSGGNGQSMQYIDSVGSTFSNNAKYGLAVYEGGNYNAYTLQHFTSTGDTFSGNANDGLSLRFIVHGNSAAPGSYAAEQDVKLSGSHFSQLNGYNGASIWAYADSAAMSQLVYVYNDAAGHGNVFSGGALSVNGVTANYGTLDAKLKVKGATFDSGYAAGLSFGQAGHGFYQPTALVNVYGNTFTGNAHYGFFGYGYYADQTFNILGNSFTNPAGSTGIYMVSVFGTTQTIHVDNTQSGLGAPYYFNDAGVSQTITY
jgi:hypothetical protein